MDGLNAPVVGWLFAISLVMLLVTPAAVGWLIVRLPKDYFTARRRKPFGVARRGIALLRPVIVVAKNLVGVLLVAAGVLMLVVPGQGVLTIVVGRAALGFSGQVSAGALARHAAGGVAVDQLAAAGALDANRLTSPQASGLGLSCRTPGREGRPGIGGAGGAGGAVLPAR